MIFLRVKCSRRRMSPVFFLSHPVFCYTIWKYNSIPFNIQLSLSPNRNPYNAILYYSHPPIPRGKLATQAVMLVYIIAL